MPSITLDRHKTVHYIERGRGEKAIVLVHGFPLDARVWDRVLVSPPPGWRIIAPDLPGFGRSSTDHAFTIDSLAEDLHQFLIQVNAVSAVVGGLSMGGYIALSYAQKCPRELRGLMLIDTRAEGDSVEGKEKRNKMIQLVREKGTKAIADQMMPNMIAKNHVSDLAITTPLREMMESCPASTIERACLAMRDRGDFTELLPSLAEPTLILVGEHDAITPVSAAEAMQRAIPRSKLIVIPGAGHMTPLESPGEVSRAIGEFVADL